MKDQLKKWWNRLTGKTSKDEQNRQVSLSGRATNNHLRAERDRLFRHRDKFRSRVHRRS